MKKITIKDVAREAGFSISTVSNALNGVDLVNEDTRSKIVEVAERLAYVPNVNGRLLKAGKSHTIGFFSCTLAGAYFQVLIEAMFRECEKKGYQLIIFPSSDPKDIVTNILGQNLDGVVIFEGTRIGEKEIETFKKNGIKMVFLDREIQGEDIASVVFDSYKAGYLITKFLINLGHKRIYYIEGDGTGYDNINRKKGYLDALREFGLEFHEEYVVSGMFEETVSYNAIITLIKYQRMEIPDAFVAGNDISAIGCIKALRECGYRVPEDISVVGFDDIEVAEYFTPPLTTIRNPIARQGVVTIDTMLSMLEDNQIGTTVRLDGTLIPRSSSGINTKN